MDDTNMFIQWAMETLEQEQDVAAAGDVFPSSLLELDYSAALQNGTHMAAHRHGANDSWSSGDSGAAVAVENDGWSSNCGTNYPAASWNFTSARAQPPSIIEATPSPPAAPGHVVPELAHRSPPSRKFSGTSTGMEPTVHEHVMAERKRREKINRRFIELSTVIPGLKRMDKATILSDALRCVKEQQEKLKAFEGREVRSIDSVVLVKRPCISNGDDGYPSPASSAAAGGGPPMTRIPLPEIEARISESNVMMRIHCQDGKGVLVTLLAEVEGLHLSITHTNVVSFPASTLIINLMAKADEGFTVTADDIVWKLDCALRRHHSSK
ncbi:hypothetical protein CFC21_074777 [Triticum aestivum]|uniref:BHLH domain-containing protein n=3 Tax=Triticum TaxID=4564 RepID=A0A9R0XNM8_TRITD|nr:transcription factor bHLH18-like isoform X2 [Triticum aestivum]XP_044394282.1 transcription factor bHLH18-like isoform X2 [Triticum aestivum]XP_044394285.1 transcription factor bHLH18-like isoform X2 [Triticum aestivum]KAF7069109.1 hypothetical protein CFC21_074777 [Triticum aestivum]VAI39753.1 unnamed protein product [Triticum turgidum subsp. durum]